SGSPTHEPRKPDHRRQRLSPANPPRAWAQLYARPQRTKSFSAKVETCRSPFRFVRVPDRGSPTPPCQTAGLAVEKYKVYEGPAPLGKGQAGAASVRLRPGLGSP